MKLTLKHAIVVFGILPILAACGGGGGDDTPPPPPPTPVDVALPSNLPAEYAPAAGMMTIQAGESMASNGVVFSCASGGEACMVTVAADGSASSTGGMVTTALTQAVADIVASRSNEVIRTAQRTTANTAITTAQNAASGINNDSTDAQVSAADKAISDAEDAVNAATALTAAERAELMNLVTAASDALDTAKTTRQTYLDKKAKDAQTALNAMAKKLHAGLGTGSTSLDSATIEISDTGAVTGDADGAATDSDPFTFKKSDAMVASYGAWKGTDYVVKTSAMTDHAVVYSNQGSGEMVPFADKWGDATDGEADIIDDASGKILQAELTAARASLIKGSDFASGSGGKDHTENANDNVVVRGTFDGADGTYECDQDAATPCRSQVVENLRSDGELQGIILTGGWSFTPDDDVEVSVDPSGEYVVYGWWSRETSDGVDVMTFQMQTGTEDNAASTTAPVTGTATYSGGAAGKFAIYNPLNAADADAGAFTAAAELTANFGDGTAEGSVTGELTDFMAGGTSRDWTVTLNGNEDESDNLAAGVITGESTTWSIGGEAANAGGSWSGNFYNAATGTGDAPMNAAGRFMSVYGDGVGRMTGAFGATKDDE